MQRAICIPQATTDPMGRFELVKWRTALGDASGLVVASVVGYGALAWHPALAPAAPSTGFDRTLVAKGAELTAIGDCAVCHAGRDGHPYAGGNPVQTPFGAIYASNITPDPVTGIGRWSEAAFRRAMHDGVDRSGSLLYPAFPYNHYTHVTDADVSAIYAFLMTRPAVAAQPPATRLPFPLGIRPIMAGWNLLFSTTLRSPPTRRRTPHGTAAPIWWEGSVTARLAIPRTACSAQRSRAAPSPATSQTDGKARD